MNAKFNPFEFEKRLIALSGPVSPLATDIIDRPWRPGALDSHRVAAVALVRVPLDCAGLSQVPASQDTHGFLLIKRSDRLRGHSGQWALPGGKQEPGESQWATAKRELFEETGVAGEWVRWLADLGTLSTGTGYLARVYLGQLDRTVKIVPDGQEAVMASAYPESCCCARIPTHLHPLGSSPGGISAGPARVAVTLARSIVGRDRLHAVASTANTLAGTGDAGRSA